MEKNIFIQKANKIHANKFSYENIPNNFNYFSEKICIICPEHGEFWQTAKTHCQHSGCPKCDEKIIKSRKKVGISNFIKRSREIHGDKYDYSKVEYKGTHEKVCIICPEHGEFWQTPNQHYKCGCAKCLMKNKISQKGIEFIKKARKIHGDKYDYSKVEYKGMYEKVCIICPEHGEFWQLPVNHMHGMQGCPRCLRPVFNVDTFIKKAREIHGDKYDYSKVEYKGTHEKVCIICPEHGEFWQTPNHHLKSCGCYLCKDSKLEKKVKTLLNEKQINYIPQFRDNWLGNQSLDFYLPDYNIGIECQGEQHFNIIKHFGGINRYIETLFRDKKKQEKCKNNGIQLIYIFEKKFQKYIIHNEILNKLYSNYQTYILNIK